EAVLYVRGEVESLGTDCVEKEMRPEHLAAVEHLLEAADMAASPGDFRRYGSARQMYSFHVDDIDAELAEGPGGTR
ncbi:MAG: hypothetical protein QGH55_04610, partial [Acidimicrobiales bacterium]|nr:hypothetical protein [Acidimicrobiales bacterium]